VRTPIRESRTRAACSAGKYFVHLEGQDGRDLAEREPRAVALVEKDPHALALEGVPLVPMIALDAFDVAFGASKRREDRPGPAPREQDRKHHHCKEQQGGGKRLAPVHEHADCNKHHGHCGQRRDPEKPFPDRVFFVDAERHRR